MNGRCGNCANYRKMVNHEDICRKTGKIVPFLAIRDCFEAKEQKPIEIEQKVKEMEQNQIKTEQNISIVERTKVCKDCGRELPVSEFGKSFRSADCFGHICRECKGKRIKGGLKKVAEPETDVVEKFSLNLKEKERKLKDMVAEVKNDNRVHGLVSDMIDAGVQVNEDGSMSIPLEVAAERARKSISRALDQELVDELRARGWEVSCHKTMVIEL